jgi:hypothetical protein
MVYCYQGDNILTADRHSIKAYLDIKQEETARTTWEHIRRHMEKDTESLSLPDLGIFNPVPLSKLLQAHNPLPLIRNINKWFWHLDVALLFPLRLVWLLISYPADLLYYAFIWMIKIKPMQR